MKKTLFSNTLTVLIISLVVSAVLTAVIFAIVGRRTFARSKINELMPRAEYLSQVTSEYMQGRLYKDDYLNLMLVNGNIWDAEVYVFSRNGGLILCTSGATHIETAYGYFNDFGVIQGQSINSLDADGKGVIVGVPVYDDERTVIGGAFLLKPITEIDKSLNALIVTLFISLAVSIIGLLVPIYFLTRRITKPLNNITTTAEIMMNGDFSVRAQENDGTDEIHKLAASFNSLSDNLTQTINDLTIERNRLAFLVDSMREGIVSINCGGLVEQYNPSAVRLLGGSEDEKIEEQPGFSEIINTAFDVIEKCECREFSQKVADRELKISIDPVQSGYGKLAGAVVLIQDVTEMNRLERTRHEYVANVSHELRTPIASIRSLADALNDNMVKTEADKYRYYGYILKESLRLSRLIDDLMELSRLRSGNLAFEKRKVDTYAIISDVAERFTDIANENGKKIILAVDENNCPYTYTNDDRIEQLLVILVDNAIKYSDAGSPITIEATECDDKLLISVKNKGHVADEDIDHLFERFYKADKSHKGGGTGLGLSIASEIISLLDEKIKVKNIEDCVVFTFSVEVFKIK